MAETVGQILKSEEVKLEGRIQLNAVWPQSSTRLHRPSSNELRVTSHEGRPGGQVHIVENQPEFAIIEMTCCCGAKTYLRCEYAGGTPQACPEPGRGGGNPAEALESAGTIEQANQ